ncbi:hypothetical protein CBFG_00316 [Clostridiales bacterium 1_7_47FAA]|nr:hypothetical protein CBFG_00316 [Clostridiales bacterium 1_7_47FAA]
MAEEAAAAAVWAEPDKMPSGYPVAAGQTIMNLSEKNDKEPDLHG